MNLPTSRASRRATAYLISTSLLPLLASTGAQAQSIEQTSAGDIVVSESSASGTPTAVDLDSGGSIDVSVGEVTGVAQQGETGPVVNLQAQSGITGDFGSITGTGNGDIQGVIANTNSGDIAIAVGTMTMDGASTSGILAVTGSGDVTLSADEVTLNGTGIEPNYNYFPDGVVGVSDDGSVDITAGTVVTHGQYGSAAAAVATDAATVTIDHGVAYSDGSVAVLAQSQGDATVNAGTVEHLGNGNAVEVVAERNGVALGDATANVGTVTAGGLGVYVVAPGGTGTVSYENVAAGRSAIAIANTQDAVVVGGEGSSASSEERSGIYVAVSNSVTIDAGGTVSSAGDYGNGIYVNAPGAIDIAAADVSVTGEGADPGADQNGMRFPQGGVIVDGGDGPISMTLGSVNVEGQYRYGVHVDTNGAVDLSVDQVSNTSNDSLAVAVRGGAGDVSVTTGTVTTDGVSGGGVMAQTGSGNIAITSDVTHLTGEGLQGNYTADAVVGISNSGNVTIVSNDSFTAGLGGTAVAGIGANVSITSTTAETTGNNGIAIYGYSGAPGGSVTVDSGSLVTGGTGTAGIYAISNGGTANVRVDDVTTNTETNTASGILARGFDSNVVIDGAVVTGGAAVGAQSFGGTSTVTVNGSVTSVNDIGISTFAQNGVVSVSEGASVEAARAAVVFTNLAPDMPGTMFLQNHGSITGSVAVYVNPNQQGIVPDVNIRNDGTLAGTTTGYAVLTSGGNDVLELTENSIVDGMVDLGEGSDRLVLDFNDDAPADAIGNVASTVNVEYLAVDSGTWLAEGPTSFYDTIEIDDSARLIVAQNEGYVSVLAPTIELYGRLDLLLTTDTMPGDLTGLLVEGDGSVHLTGPATLLVDDASGLQYTGGTFVENGTLLLTDTFDGAITTTGTGVFQLGNGGTEGDYTGTLVNNGTFVFNRSDDYTLAGDFSGTGQFDKYGDGTIYFDGLYDFDGVTNVYAGVVGLSGTIAEDTELDLSDGAAFDLSRVDGGEATIAELAGDGGTLILGDTMLTVEQDGDTTFAGSLEGTGTFVKDGSGDLKLAGDSPDFTGDATVEGGTLSVNGDYSNASFFVETGGTLGGNGTIGDTMVQGGTLAAGNSIDVLTIAGDLTLTSASIFEVEANAAGQSDRVDVTGSATLGGATVNVLAYNGVYAPETSYTILTAAGGLNGTFGSVNSNLAFLDPSLSYSADTVTLMLTRNDVDYSTYAATGNQAAVGNLIEALGYGSTLYDATLVLDRSTVAGYFQTLTGEVYPAYGAALIESADLIRRESDDAMMQGGDGTFVWGSAVQQSVRGDGGAGYRDIKLNGAGVLAGVGFGAGPFKVALGGGKVWHNPKDVQISDSSIAMLVGQVGFGGGAGLNAKAGIQYGWVNADVSRRTNLGTIAATVSSEPDGNIAQYYAEVGYNLVMGGAYAIEPFAGIRQINLDFDPIVETGGATALTVTDLDRDVTFADLGLRLSSQATGVVAPYASVNWRRAWGDRASTGSIAFAGSAASLGISALPIARSAVQAGAGFVFRGSRVTASIGYEGSFSKSFDGHGAKAGLTFAF